jgi:hypothetical protein
MTRRCLLQAARCAIVLVMLAACGGGDPDAKPANGWVTVTDEPSGARIALPNAANRRRTLRRPPTDLR